MEQLQQYLRTDIGFYVSLFALLGISEQLSNGILGTHFDTKQLCDIFTFIFAQLSIKHGIDSALNSKRGESPEQR